MKIVVYKNVPISFYTSGSQAWKSKEDKKYSLQKQRVIMKAAFNDFIPKVNRKYHVRIRYYLEQKRLGSDLDNLLKEFNDIVFGKSKDRYIFSMSAIKKACPYGHIKCWIYEIC